MERHISHHLHLLPTTKSALEARAVLEDEELNPQITTLSIRASLKDVDKNINPTWDAPTWGGLRPELYGDGAVQGIEINGVLSLTFKSLLSDIGLFRNLRRLELTHDDEVDSESRYGTDGREDREYREAFFKAVILALNHPDHPAQQMHSLSVINIQDATNYELVKSHDFSAVIARLDSLELCVVSERDDSSPENNITMVERHVFFGRDLQQYWLKPLQDKLIKLKIYSSCLWGYLPKCDLRGLHFPRLKSLSLGNMTFTHDWQLDWIISHHTLELLTLDDCPIVHEAMIDHDEDFEWQIAHNDAGRQHWPWKYRVHWSYGARWHDYFRKLHRGLPDLQRFGVGRGPWGSPYGFGQPSGAFMAAASMPARLAASRYIIYDNGVGCEPENSRKDEYEKITVLEGQYDAWDEDDPTPQPLYPDCWDDDQNTLDGLLEAAESRRRWRAQVLLTQGFTMDYRPSQGSKGTGSESEWAA
jgi:hypothetical protein